MTELDRLPQRGGVPIAQPQGPVVAGSAVVLADGWLGIARQAVLIADKTRRRNGLPSSRSYIALAEALTSAMSVHGHSDVRETEELQDHPQELAVTIADAAEQLGLSERQTRRLAQRLGGKRIAGRWLLDQDAIDDHRNGSSTK